MIVDSKPDFRSGAQAEIDIQLGLSCAKQRISWGHQHRMHNNPLLTREYKSPELVTKSNSSNSSLKYMKDSVPTES